MSDDLLASFRDRLRAGGTPALWQELEKTLLARREQRGGHSDWGLLCEQAGLVNLAFREFQLALRDDPNDAIAAFRLAHHYRERGDSRRAADLLERLLATDPAREDWLALYAEVLHEEGARPRLRAALERAVKAGLSRERASALDRAGPAEEEEELTGEGELAPTDADCARFLTLFAGREDVHARQWAQAGEGGYSPVREPLTPTVVRNHLLGNYTVGVYPVRLDGTCTFFALDLDIDRAAVEQARTRPTLAQELRNALRREARRILDALRGLGFAPLFEDSGYKGRHFWVFLAQPEPAEALHQLGRQILAWLAPPLPRGLHLEFFPKQGTLKGKGLGNLIKLPLGIHRRTGRRANLLDDDGRPLARPLAALRAVVRLPRTGLLAAAQRLKELVAPAISSSSSPAHSGEEGQPAKTPPGPPPPPPAPAWTEADFDNDPRFRHLLQRCPVLAELKRTVDEHRRLSHEEQLVLIHTLGHLEGGPQAVNYLFSRCLDIAPEKLLKDRLKGNPVSCPSIRKKIGHVTRRVPCHCHFDFAPDRYPTPLLHLLTVPATPPGPPPPSNDVENLARRYAAAVARRDQLQRECDQLLKALTAALAALPDRAVACPGGRYRLVLREGVEELLWEPEAGP